MQLGNAQMLVVFAGCVELCCLTLLTKRALQKEGLQL